MTLIKASKRPRPTDISQITPTNPHSPRLPPANCILATVFPFSKAINYLSFRSSFLVVLGSPLFISLKRISLTGFLMLCLFTSKAQLPELGIMGGGMYYLGDLNPLGNFKETHFTGSLFLRQNFSRR